MDTLAHRPLPDRRLCDTGAGCAASSTGGWTLLSIAASPTIDTTAQECTASHPANRRMDTLVHYSQPLHRLCGTRVCRLLSRKQEDGHSCPSQLAPPSTLRHKSVPTPVQKTGGWTLLSIAAGPTIDTAAQECAASCPANRRMDTLVHRS